MTRHPPTIPQAHDKVLFTPGPLTTSLAVKQAMLHDAGSWHFEFNAKVLQIREKLLALAGLDASSGYETILMQGSGTFGVEAVLASTIPRNGKLLVLANGAYGERMAQMAQLLRIDHSVLRSPEDRPPDLRALEGALDSSISDVAVVHCETTTGILNPIADIAHIVKHAGKTCIVDAMSSFGAIPIDIRPIDYLISSANKCIEGVPGFSFVIARRAALLATEGNARSLSLDLLAQLKAFEKNGQFRYSPPTHSILAFEQALLELELEGGIEGRGRRYRRNHEVLLKGMLELGFESYLAPDFQSCIITSFYFPKHPNFTFQDFYHRLSDHGMIIYPGKISQVDCFRIGSIGRIFETDMKALLAAIREVLAEMGVPLPASNSSVLHESNPHLP